MGRKFHFHHCKLKPCWRWLLATEARLGSEIWACPFPGKALECKSCPSNVGGSCIALCLCCWWVGIPKQAAPAFRCSRRALGTWDLILLLPPNPDCCGLFIGVSQLVGCFLWWKFLVGFLSFHWVEVEVKEEKSGKGLICALRTMIWLCTWCEKEQSC